MDLLLDIANLPAPLPPDNLTPRRFQFTPETHLCVPYSHPCVPFLSRFIRPGLNFIRIEKEYGEVENLNNFAYYESLTFHRRRLVHVATIFRHHHPRVCPGPSIIGESPNPSDLYSISYEPHQPNLRPTSFPAPPAGAGGEAGHYRGRFQLQSRHRSDFRSRS